MRLPMSEKVSVEIKKSVNNEKVNFFSNASIQIITDSVKDSIVELKDAYVKTPFFAVKVDDQNYIYSFDKIFEGINKEIDYVKKGRYIWLMTTVLFALPSLIILLFLKGEPLNQFPAVMCIYTMALSICSLMFLIVSFCIHSIGKLKEKKNYVILNSQSYITEINKKNEPILIL
jgi:hypothetical protein